MSRHSFIYSWDDRGILGNSLLLFIRVCIFRNFFRLGLAILEGEMANQAWKSYGKYILD